MANYYDGPNEVDEVENVKAWEEAVDELNRKVLKDKKRIKKLKRKKKLCYGKKEKKKLKKKICSLDKVIRKAYNRIHQLEKKLRDSESKIKMMELESKHSEKVNELKNDIKVLKREQAYQNKICEMLFKESVPALYRKYEDNFHDVIDADYKEI